jgi:hypothetical protein
MHDTLSISKRLIAKGIAQEHAEALAIEISEVGRDDHLVTKEYLKESLKDALDKLEMKLTIKTGTMLFVGFGFLAAIKFFGIS